jgi:hypothetical protein
MRKADSTVPRKAPSPTIASEASKIRDGLVAVAEWEADNGPLTDTELYEARARLDRRARRASKRIPITDV